MSDFVKRFRAAVKVSTPLLAAVTPDALATINDVKASLTKPRPLITWDAMRGLQALDEMSIDVLHGIELPDGATPELIRNPAVMLAVAAKLPPKSMMFTFNLNMFWDDPVVKQGIWNLRDVYKGDNRTFIMLSNTANIPKEIRGDVFVIEQPLPKAPQLEEIVRRAYKSIGVKPTEEDVISARDVCCGMSPFAAEQACMMSIDPDSKKFDFPMLLKNRKSQLEQVKGVSLYEGPEFFKDITGLENAKDFFNLRGAGRDRRRGIVVIDEIDKHVSGFGAHGTGDTTTEMVGALLTRMSAIKAEGCLAVGVQGAGKTHLAKAIGNEWGVPCIFWDFAAMKGQHVGDSGDNTRAAMDTICAMTDDAPFFFATCNDIKVLPTELRRRFSSSTFFFDLTTPEERAAAWKYYLKFYELTDKKLPDDTDWTPSEISVCCYNASKMRKSVVESAKWVVPVAKAGAATIRELRQLAHNTFISASKPGVYQMPKNIAQAGERKVASV